MQQDSNKTLRTLAFYFGLLMVTVYIALGLALIFSNAFFELLPQNRALLGTVILFYAAFRIYMTMRLRKKNINPPEN
jgi:hypothetical protein